MLESVLQTGMTHTVSDSSFVIKHHLWSFVSQDTWNTSNAATIWKVMCNPTEYRYNITERSKDLVSEYNTIHLTSTTVTNRSLLIIYHCCSAPNVVGVVVTTAVCDFGIESVNCARYSMQILFIFACDVYKIHEPT